MIKKIFCYLGIHSFFKYGITREIPSFLKTFNLEPKTINCRKCRHCGKTQEKLKEKWIEYYNPFQSYMNR
jgi:hypothetical protein